MDKSPTTPPAVSTRAYSSQLVRGGPPPGGSVTSRGARKANTSQAPTAAKTRPPSSPSTVLPGLIRGASLWRPANRPTVYAPISLILTITSREIRGRVCQVSTLTNRSCTRKLSNKPATVRFSTVSPRFTATPSGRVNLASWVPIASSTATTRAASGQPSVPKGQSAG